MSSDNGSGTTPDRVCRFAGSRNDQPRAPACHGFSQCPNDVDGLLAGATARFPAAPSASHAAHSDLRTSLRPAVAIKPRGHAASPSGPDCHMRRAWWSSRRGGPERRDSEYAERLAGVPQFALEESPHGSSQPRFPNPVSSRASRAGRDFPPYRLTEPTGRPALTLWPLRVPPPRPAA